MRSRLVGFGLFSLLVLLAFKGVAVGQQTEYAKRKVVIAHSQCPHCKKKVRITQWKWVPVAQSFQKVDVPAPVVSERAPIADYPYGTVITSPMRTVAPRVAPMKSRVVAPFSSPLYRTPLIQQRYYGPTCGPNGCR